MNRQTIMENSQQGLAIFQYYLGSDLKVGVAFKSPLREDRNPSFSIYKDKVGLYRFKDHAKEIKGDAIQFVSLYHKISYPEAMKRIIHDLSIDLETHTTNKKTHTTPAHDVPVALKVITKPAMEPFELAYWKIFGIDTHKLLKYRVCALMGSCPGNPKFGYHFDWGYKVYMPFQEKRFFYYGDKPEDYVFGWDQLPAKGRLVILAGGEKDVLSLHAHDYSAIALNSEGADIPKELIQQLRNRFELVCICYDVDPAGKKYAEKHTKIHDLINISLPLRGAKDSKDVSDFFALGKSKSDFQLIINQAIDSYYKQVITELSDKEFDPSVDIPEPIPVLRIDDAIVLSEGNLAGIAGKAKTGKTSLLISTLSGAITHPDLEPDFYLGIDVVPNLDGLPVLHFDTEQSLFDYHKKMKLVLRRAGWGNERPSFFHSYHLLEFTPWERLNYIRKIIQYHALKSNGLYLVVIDGIADLIKSVNDEEDANTVINILHQLATRYQAAVLVVLHLNPDGGKTRGHLGSQLDRKAETIIQIDREGDVCTLVPKYCRNASFSEIPMKQYQWDSVLKRHVYLGERSHEQRIDRLVSECEEALQQLSDEQIWDRAALRKQICEVMNVSRTTGYERINFMLQQNLIQETEDGRLAIIAS